MLPIRHIVLSILTLLPTLATAAVPTTNVTGSFNLPSGVNPNNVTLTLTPSHEFQVQDASGNKYQIPKVPQVFSIPNAGAVNINIIPNTGRSNSPDLTTYSVKLQAGRYVDESLTWQVGYNTLGINLSDLRVSTPSSGSSSFLELVGGVLTGKLTLASTNTLPGLRWPVTTEPTGASAGDTYINSSDFKLYVYNGLGSWLASTGSGLTSIFHYTDLSGSGTSGAPLYITPGAAGSVLLTNTAGTSVTATALSGAITVNGSGVATLGPTLNITTGQISATAGILGSQLSASAGIVGSQLSASAGIVGGQITTVPNALTNPSSNTTMTLTGNGTGGVSFGTEPVEIKNLSGAGGTDADGDIPVRAGTYVRLPKGSNSTVLGVSSGGVVGYSTVTNAMLAGSITGDKISTLPNSAGNVSGDWTNTPVGTNWILAANKILQIVGGSADPSVVGGFNYDTDTKAFTVKSDIGVQSIVGTWYVQTSDSSAIANTASETDFDQLPPSFPANSLKAGRTIMWWATYIASTTGTPTLRIRHKFGSVTISDTTGYTTSSGMTNRALTLQGKMTIRTVGASGTYLADITYGPVTITGTGQYISSSGPTSEFGTVGATIDTTAGNVLKDTAQWSAGSPSNTIKRVALTVAVY